MKQIILAQHADVNGITNGGRDIDRLLTADGLIKATDVSNHIAEYCKKMGFDPKLLCSQAYRTIVEAYMIAGILNKDRTNVEINTLLYQENKRLIQGCLNYVNGLNNDCPIIVSHIPTIPLLVHALTKHTREEIIFEDLDRFYSQNEFDINTYMQSGEVEFGKGNAYGLVFDNDGKGHLDRVFK